MIRICPKCREPFEYDPSHQQKKVYCTPCRHDKLREDKTARDRARGAAGEKPMGYPKFVMAYLKETSERIQSSRDLDSHYLILSR